MRLDGSVAAQVQFQPLSIVRVGNAATLLPPDAVIAANSVFFADAPGTIRRLDSRGTVTSVATFPISNIQQLLSFAVSPDGLHLGAIVVSLPPVVNPPPTSLAEPFFVPGAHGFLDLEWADAGGTTQVALHRDLGTDFNVFERPTLLVGWDSEGPLATLQTEIGTQSGLVSRKFQGTQLIHLARDGTHLSALGGPNCNPIDLVASGKVLCSTPPTLQVRNTSGQALWSMPWGDCSYPPLLSLSGQTIACTNFVFESSSRISYPPVRPGYAQDPQAWIDDSTLVYYLQDPVAPGLVWGQLPDLTTIHRLTSSSAWADGFITQGG